MFSLKPGKTSVVKFQIQNITKHDTFLPKCIVLGLIQFAQSVTSLAVKFKDNIVGSEPRLSESSKGDSGVKEDILSHIEQINLDGLEESK